VTPAADPLRLELPAEADSVAPARHAVTAYAERLGVIDSWAVAISVSEAITNGVLHAYNGREPGRIVVTAELHRGDVLTVTVRDHGHGLTPRSDSPGLGLGLPLVAQLTERFEVESPDDGGTRVRMHFAA
jgi:serine/threonine-protein kinase RsbW